MPLGLQWSCVALVEENVIPTGMVDIHSMTSLPWIQGTTTALGECGGGWRTGFTSSQHCILVTNSCWPHCIVKGSQLPLLGSARVYGAKRQIHNFTAIILLPAMTVGTAMLFKASSCLYQALLQWRGKGICFFMDVHCFCLSYTLGCSVRAIATATTLAGAAVGTKLSFPHPTSPTSCYNTPKLSCPDAWIFQVYLYVEQGILKGRNKGVFLLHHNAYITPIFVFFSLTLCASSQAFMLHHGSVGHEYS